MPKPEQLEEEISEISDFFKPHPKGQKRKGKNHQSKGKGRKLHHRDYNSTVTTVSPVPEEEDYWNMTFYPEDEAYYQNFTEDEYNWTYNDSGGYYYWNNNEFNDYN